ncbi:gp69 [Burkholderia lata]|uniref:helix-turn-helix domain-containing protein n=1 Tax=Burkholderia lata (strain ATCC 17760 / DSM 23089 / LMG 22485 / NCIMB 9086 / R18194 / 383) TaxID=482957 RepID=UPI00145324FD|nr:helix-turn-helix domain-containing protein [Burkholderia lata]VWC40675.1 gp69 [Burkholderia lata]
MSAAHVSAAWAYRLPPTPKLLLIALADLADDRGNCSPTIAALAECIGVRVIAIHGALRQLDAAGLVHIERRSDFVNIYSLQLPRARCLVNSGSGEVTTSRRIPCL